MAEALKTPNYSIELRKKKISECHKKFEEMEGETTNSINDFKNNFQKTLSECHQRANQDYSVNSKGNYLNFRS